MKNISELNILFLAKYAPVDSIDYTAQEDYIDEHAKYHFELCEELSKIANVIPSNNFEDIITYKNDINFIFSVYNKANFKGSEILSSVLAEYYHIPYMGAYPTIRAIAEDKHLAKMVAKQANMQTPNWKIINSPNDIECLTLDFKGPYFIKPRFGANSEGIDLASIQTTLEGVKQKVATLIKKFPEVIIEQYIDGIYYTVPACKIDNKITVFRAIRQFSENPFHIVTPEQKTHVQDGLTRTWNNNQELQKVFEEKVTAMYQLLEPLDFARFDFIVDEMTGTPYYIETNICCSLSKRSTFASAAKESGIEYSELIRMLIENSLKRQL